MPKTSSRALQALTDYLHLGPTRTLPNLLQQYQQRQDAPTQSYTTLRKWSGQQDWAAHASIFDEQEETRAQAEYRAKRDAIMQRGLALEHQRVETLALLYEKLSNLTHTDEALWITNVKTLRLENEQIERIELRRFNGALIRHLRGLLHDIAAETGGRLHTPPPPDGPEKSTIDTDNLTLDVLTPTERAEFLRLQSKIFTPSNPQ